MLPEEHCATAHKYCACATKKHFGLTLAELLVILLVSSVIMVVLAPVVRKQKSDIGTTSSSSATVGRVLYSYLSPRPECTNSTSDNTLTCTFSAPQGVKFVNIHMVGAGGGGAGATSATAASPTTKTQTSASELSIPIVAGMQNVTVNNLIGGGGGGGGGMWSETAGAAPPTSQADCDKYDAKYLTASQNGGKAVCVTKYNIGDIPSATNGGIASSVTTVSTGTDCSKNSCCWQGKTASPCDSSGTSYSGCNRTVCTWYAANDSCLALAYNGTKAGDWRLPTKDELAKWKSNLSTINTNQGDNGLRLCDINSGYGAAWCNLSDVCDGARNINCFPYYVWSSTARGIFPYYCFLKDGTFVGPYDNDSRYAYSSRCVYEGRPSTFTSRSGGGGGAAAAMNTTIPESIISDNVGGKIVLYAGAGGTGKSSGTGGEGGTSYVYVYNSSNVLKWGIKAPGGKGGTSASSTKYGTGGAYSNSCQMYNGTSWVATTYTSRGAAGSHGTTETGITVIGAAIGGRGGSSTYNTSTNGGRGGNISDKNGSTGTAYGAGGGGGTVRFSTVNSTVTPYIGKGGDGKGGIARITYSMSSQAAAGGGGAGASYAFLENVPVTAGRTYTVKVGNGGNGGAVNIDGTDGGVTSVQYDGGTYTINGGKAGKKGTSGSGTSLIQGLGGALGTSNIPSANLRAGVKGSNASYLSDVSSGGNGGKSGINTDGGCGGFQTTDCTNVASSGKNSQYVLPANLHTTARQFGSAGAGGGGGAWKLAPSSDSGPGGGANGQAGYVYIYWIENN